MHFDDLRKRVLNQVRVKLGNRDAYVPRTATGEELRSTLNVPDNRMLIVRSSSGDAATRVPDNTRVQIEDDAVLDHIPIGHWGE